MEKIKFNNGTVPALSAENLNKLQDNIEAEINKNTDNINKNASNAYFIGRYTKELEIEGIGATVNLNPDKIVIKNMKFEDRMLSIEEDGLYYVNIYIHFNGGVVRSFIDTIITDGGSLSPTTIRSQDTQNMYYDKDQPTGGDPAFELNRPVFLKKGAKLRFQLYVSSTSYVSGSEKFATESTCISVIKIGNYPSEVTDEDN